MKNARRYLVIVTLLSPFSLNSKLIEISSREQFKNEIIDSGVPAVLKFSATWCAPCRLAREPFEKVAQTPAFSHVIFAEIDIDTHPDITKEYSIESVPSFLFIEGGKVKGKESGFSSVNQFVTNFSKKINDIFSLSPAPSKPVQQDKLTTESHKKKGVQECPGPSLFLKIWESFKKLFTRIGQYIARTIDSVKKLI